jgi:NADPH:quinone reductase-like Zn-dependent oxidoreductase
VQLAVAAGARVIATVGRAEKVNVVKALGAHLVVNYRKEDFVEVVLDETNGIGVDVCFDGVGGSPVSTPRHRTSAGGCRPTCSSCSWRARYDRSLAARHPSSGGLKPWRTWSRAAR